METWQFKSCYPRKELGEIVEFVVVNCLSASRSNVVIYDAATGYSLLRRSLRLALKI